MVNETLIRETVSMIEANHSRWNQNCFFQAAKEECDTVMCFAGWAVYLNEGCRLVKPEGKRNYTLPGVGSIEQRAQQILGFTYEQAEEIFFFMTDDLEALKQKITKVTGVTFDEPESITEIPAEVPELVPA